MRIINFGQMVNLEHGKQSIDHQITVEMRSGQRAQIRTDEQTVQQLVDALTGDTEPPRQKTLEEMLQQDIYSDVEGLAEEAYSESGEIFGGDSDPGELTVDDREPPDPEVFMGALAGRPPVMEAEAPKGGLGQVKRPPIDSDGFYLPVPPKTVPKDEMGYPIVQRRSAPVTVVDDDGESDGNQI